MKGLELVAVLLVAVLQSRSNEFCTIEGTVLNAPTGNPLVGASVQIVPVVPPSPANGPPSPRFLTTDSSGHFIADHILPASYMLYATSNGYVRQGYGQRDTVKEMSHTYANVIGGNFNLECTPS